MTTTPATTDSPMQDEQLDIFRLMHRSMRQDAAALVAALQAPGADRPALARWFTAYAAGIVHHHEVEDDIFWPVLAEHSAAFAEAAPVLEADHHHLDEAMHRVATALAGANDEEALAAARALSEVLDDHLDREEAVAIPAMLACLSAAEYDAMSTEATKRDGLRSMAWIVPWLLDHADEEEAAAGLATLPPPIRWLNSLRWTRRYQRRAAPLRTARRARIGGGTLVALVVVLAALFAGCGNDDAGASAGPSAPVDAPTAQPASDITITATDYSFESSSQRIASGRVRMTLDNQGDEPHQVQFGLVEPGTTADSFYETFHTDGAGAAEKLLRWQTGVNAVEPGEQGSVVGDLEPGQYLMVCFVPGHDGQSHIDKKMIVPVEVVPGGDEVAEPTAEGEVVLEDYAITMPKGFDGNGTFAVRNAGPADHELILMRFKDGKDLNDLIAWSDGGSKGVSPVTYESGIGTIPRGETSWVDLDLGSGSYIALCAITGPTGMPHALMGMTAQFELA
jgi:hemerythrin-like domain-containing protein/uncharacterized cupredoxin-like copper-binding protein